MTLHLLGVDPGKLSGACAVLDAAGLKVLSWLCYAEATRKGVQGLAYASDAPGCWGWTPHDDLPLVVVSWRPGHAYRLAVEGLFAFRGQAASPSSLLGLGESAGVLQGILRVSSVGPVHRPLANDWRRRQLRTRRGLNATACEQYAIRCAEGTFSGLPTLARLGELGMARGQALTAYGALCEAAWIARDLRTVTT